MSQTATVSEPTRHEADRAASTFPQTLDQFEAQCLADAPPPRPRDPEPASGNGSPKWGLPRLASNVSWLESTVRTTIAKKYGYLSLSLIAETVESGSATIADCRLAIETDSHTRAHGALIASDEYRVASGILPLLASAERRHAAASVRLDGLAQRRAKLVAHPTPSLGKALVALDAETVVCRAEIAEHQAERDALAPAAAEARAALAAAAVPRCREAQFAVRADRQKMLEEKTARFYAEHGEELTELAVLASVRGPDQPTSSAALVKMLVDDLVAPRAE